jgi:KDO2-lipid IV(A) lauroyltransferase
VAAAAGTLGYLVQRERRRASLENLAHTAPNASERTRRLLARRTFRNMTSTAVDLYRLPSMAAEELRSLVAVSGREHLDAALAKGRGVICVTGHVGPYELGGAWLSAQGYAVHAMVEDLTPDVSEALAMYRRATGMQLISMNQGLRSVFKLLEENRLVLLVADRAVGDTRGVVELPFCNGVRAVPTGPATFAMATGAPIIVGHIFLNPDRGARYVMQLEPPIVANGRGDGERLRLTRWITDRIADVVQKHPDEWYVFQPQWMETDRE